MKERDGQGIWPNKAENKRATFQKGEGGNDQKRTLSDSSSLQIDKSQPKENNKNTESHVWELFDRRRKQQDRRIKRYKNIAKDRPLSNDKEFFSEYDKIEALTKEINENGTTRENQILELYNDLTNPVDPYYWSNRGHVGELTQEELQTFRLDIESLSDKRLTKEVTWVRKQRTREEKEIERSHRDLYDNLNKKTRKKRS